MSENPEARSRAVFTQQATEAAIRIGILVLLVGWCFQIVRPFDLFSATIAPRLPPGVKISLSPSMSGDSAYFQPPTLPSKSFVVFFQTTDPSDVRRQTSIPPPVRQ